MDKYNYYRSELSNIDTKSEYAPTIQIKDAEGNKTKNMNLNKESAKELVVWLQNNFILKAITLLIVASLMFNCSSPSSRRSKERARQLTEQLNNVNNVENIVSNIVGQSDAYTLELIHKGQNGKDGDFDIYRLIVEYAPNNHVDKSFIIVDNGQFGITMSDY